MQHNNSVIQKFLGIAGFMAFMLMILPSPLYAQYSLRTEDKTKKEFQFTIPGGKSVDSKVIVKNLGKENVTLSVYAADGTKTDLGALTLIQPYEAQKGIGNWTKLEENTVSLEKNAQTEIPFHILIPAGTPPGTYAGGIAVASITNKRASEINTGAGAIASTRVILPIIIAIPGERIIDYSWKNFSYSSLEHNFILTLENNGNTIVEVNGDIMLSGFPFYTTEKIPVSHITLLQKETASIPIKIDKVPLFGFFTAQTALNFSEKDLINRTTKLLSSEERSIHYTIIPWLYVVIVFGIVVLGLFLCYIRRQQWKKYLSRCNTYTVAENETFVSLAKKYGIPWKKLAKINGLKPPFEIHTGQSIKVPPQP